MDQFQHIKSITDDSRHVKNGDAFIAISGYNSNGADYIDEAIQNGASTIIVQNNMTVKSHIPPSVKLLYVDDTRLALSKICENIYPHSMQKMMAVTGTNGKTSVVNFLCQLWEMHHIKAASIGTMGTILNHHARRQSPPLAPMALTTPSSIYLHQEISALSRDDIRHLAIEASSHGLNMHRLSGFKFHGAAFTNFSQDHLDFHGTMEHYLKSKLSLFENLMHDDATIVANYDSGVFSHIKNIAKDKGLRLISCGFDGGDIHIYHDDITNDGFSLKINFLGKDLQVLLPLKGRFQIENALTAAALCHAIDDDNITSDDETIIDNLQKLKPVPGRMQHISHAIGDIYIDYAHTPDALENVLYHLKKHCKGKLITVFGCGGDRDRKKRPLMANAVCKYATHAIITDDNPRNENPCDIRAEIARAMTIEYDNIAGREQAIEKGIKILKENKGSILLIAGKGHEITQIIRNTTLPFDDSEVAKKILLNI